MGLPPIVGGHFINTYNWSDLGFKGKYFGKEVVLIADAGTTPLQWGMKTIMIYDGVKRMFAENIRRERHNHRT